MVRQTSDVFSQVEMPNILFMFMSQCQATDCLYIAPGNGYVDVSHDLFNAGIFYR